MDSDELTIAFPFRSRVGTIHDGDALWGYLYVWQDVITTSLPFGVRRTRDECLWVEDFRVLPPEPDAPDHGNMLGWSDGVMTGDDAAWWIEHLRRCEYVNLGRSLRITWLDGDDAESVWDQYFKERRNRSDAAFRPTGSRRNARVTRVAAFACYLALTVALIVLVLVINSETAGTIATLVYAVATIWFAVTVLRVSRAVCPGCGRPETFGPDNDGDVCGDCGFDFRGDY